MELLALLLFFAVTYGLGFSLARLVKESDGFLERHVMRVGFGLCALVVLGIALNAFRIPIDWRIILAAALAGPAYFAIFRKGHAKLRFSATMRLSGLGAIAALVIFGFSLFMYSSGAFSYPYLEDDDPWGHASAASYVASEKTVFDSPFLNFQYMDPYPPGYDMMFGILRQVSGSVMWVVKFFNALIISLSVLFFYFFARQFTGSSGRALFAMLVLASVPAYLSHFIWAPALAMAVFFPAVYALVMAGKGGRWWVVAGVCLAAIAFSHPTHAVKLLAMVAIYVFVSMVSARRLWLRQSISCFKAIAVGAAVSLLWWGSKISAFTGLAKGGLRSGTEAGLEQIRSSPNLVVRMWNILTQVLNAEGGTATRVYSFSDFFVARGTNMINNPVGFGVAASLLAFAGIVFAVARVASFVPRPRISIPAAFVAAFVVTLLPLGMSPLQLVLAAILSAFFLSLVAVFSAGNAGSGVPLWIPTTLGWLLFAFLGVNSKTFELPVGLFAFRFWMILAVPVALIAAEGLFGVFGLVRMFRLPAVTASAARLAILSVVVAGVLLTSAGQKYEVNTACWPAGAFWGGNFMLEPSSGCPVPAEVVAYSWLSTLPSGTKVFTFSNPDQVLAYGAFSCGWCEPEYGMKKRFSNVTAEELHGFMGQNGYDYAVVGGIEARGFGVNATMRLVQELASSGMFSLAYQH